MASQSGRARYALAGGLASDFGSSVQVTSDGGLIAIPFLLEAKDIYYTLNGGVRKIGGTERLGAAFGTGGIDSLHDYWYTVLGAPIQKRVAYASNGNLYVDNADGVFASITSTMAMGAKVYFSQFDEDLIILSSGADVPQVYDGSTLETLGTNTPNGSFAAVYKNRLWMAGVPSTPSTVYYSKTLPDGPRGDWGGADSGTIQINPGDGDSIRGLVSYKDNLFIFKGPNRGSIHRIEGSSPTGSDPFARRDFLEKGLPTDSPNGFFLVRDDLAFITSDGEIHSLKSTASFGDFNESSFSLPINRLLHERVSRTSLFRADTATWSTKGLALIAIAFDGSTRNNMILAMDYRFDPVRWALWEDYNATTLARVVDIPQGRDGTVMIGGSDNVVRRIDRVDAANHATTGGTYAAITGRITTPFLAHGGPQDQFTLQAASVNARPDGIGTITFGWSWDGQRAQTETFAAQGDASTLGASFIMGSSILAYNESRSRHVRTETGGEGNQIQYQISNGTLGSTSNPGSGHRMELEGFETVLSGPVESLEN